MRLNGLFLVIFGFFLVLNVTMADEIKQESERIETKEFLPNAFNFGGIYPTVTTAWGPLNLWRDTLGRVIYTYNGVIYVVNNYPGPIQDLYLYPGYQQWNTWQTFSSGNGILYGFGHHKFSRVQNDWKVVGTL
ncbi:hypothetical protein CROQUDRAFT_86467 [Cronartium quercuum f. sp. fusiforme G11]|uniref:Uncharacterized protein n=1 Tax=Cronartium quercuum f. sp. fusiforme G11 TaxID=708437 RepID=A0A9P6NYN4_9BASI|nr:hypothetical protein CROQUDRAFT_86467 [Cronartium quercuum f. sp. fusiforme G11]